MEIRDAQMEMRTVFLGGCAGSLASFLLWAASAALWTWVSARAGIITICAGGVLLFPLSLLILRLMGRRAALSRENPLAALARQAAFIIPLCLPLVGAAALYRLGWFYPALLIVVGAHYLPFVTLYGMPEYYVVGGLMIGAGLAIGYYAPENLTLGGWAGAGILLISAYVLARATERHGTRVSVV
jgi:hypothetical protein